MLMSLPIRRSTSGLGDASCAYSSLVAVHKVGDVESGDSDCLRGGRQERGESLATTIGLEAPGQVFQHVAARLSAGGHHGQHPLDEPAPTLALGPATDPAPDHRVTQRTL